MGSVGIELECLLKEDPQDSVLGREHVEQIHPRAMQTVACQGSVLLPEPTC